jgi:predicted nucleic acid-binding protein
LRHLTYDAGALLAAESGRLDVWLLHKDALANNREPLVPAIVLAQAWRGGPQALLSRFLQGCVVIGFAESAARDVGTALARSATRDVADAAVVVCALRYDCAVVTSDPDDLQRIAAGLGQKLPVIAV